MNAKIVSKGVCVCGHAVTARLPGMKIGLNRIRSLLLCHACWKGVRDIAGLVTVEGAWGGQRGRVR
jgi:hypothetical protein